MTTFWIICAVLLLIALLFVVLPLWRSSQKSNEVVRDEANLAILRDQSAEMDADLKNGLLTQEAYDQAKRELQMRLVDEVKDTAPATNVLHSPSKVLAMSLAVLVPVASFMMYEYLGSRTGLLYTPPEPGQARAQTEQTMTPEQVEALAHDLKKRPNNPEGWWNLAQAYAQMQRYPESLAACKKLTEIFAEDAQVWASCADIYAMANGRSLQGDAANMLKKALELDPENMTALVLSGNGAMERGDAISAIRHWQKLLGMLQPGSQEHQMIMNSIQRAHEVVMQPGSETQGRPLDNLPSAAAEMQQVNAPAGESAAPAGDIAITGTVTLSPSIAAKAAPTDYVFILAKNAGGGRMPPLAVMRKQVSDLPIKFTLDDSLAMNPQMRLSTAKEVIVVARVSKTGAPVAQPGDLQGSTGVIKTGTKDLKVTIDTIAQ